MKIKIYSIFIIGALLSSCSTTPKIIHKTNVVEKIIRDTVYITQKINDNNDKIISAKLNNFDVSYNRYPSASQDFRQKFLILHYTALDNEKSFRVLTQQKVSVHYLVNDIDDDVINLLVSEDKRAWHAGVSYWQGRTNLNDSSIGIEIVNQGYYKEGDKKIFYPFPEYQFKKVAALAKDIVERYQIEPTYVLGHSDIAPYRKEDPGAFFPWKRLYDEYGIGAWYDENDKNYYLSKFPYGQTDTRDFILNYQKDLAKYGYQVNEDGIWGKEMERLTSTFQLHFRQSDYSGVLDAETWAILKALNKKYRN